MLFYGVFLRETARTAAKSRTNLRTNSGKATKRLDRLAPNLAHMCRFIWEWIYAKQIAPRYTRWCIEWVRGSNIQKSWEAVKRRTDLHQLWFTSADSSGNGYTPNKFHLDSQGGTCGVLEGQTFKSLGKLSNGLTDWHQLWFTSAGSSGNEHRLNRSRPSIPQAAFRGLLGGHKFKSLGKLSNGCTDSPLHTC